MIECMVHLEEACGPDCGPDCDSKWHHRRAINPRSDNPVCRECADEQARISGAERTYAAQYAHACGYRD